jgi:nucleoside 2-deoxyribosyltransferase
MKVYLAGPLGFSEAGRLFHHDKIIKLMIGLGHEILDPWELTPPSEIVPILEMPYGPAKKAAWEAKNPEIGHRNREAIDSADAVFAVLDGVDVDSGTAAEIGYAFAVGKPIIGYRGDFRLSADNEGSVVNLQVEYFIHQSGGQIIQSIEHLPAALEQLPLEKGQQTDASAREHHLIRRPKARTKKDYSGGNLIIGILLALIVRAALEAFFKDPIQEEHPWPNVVVWFQLIAFVLLVVRFYLGATRFLDTQPEKAPFVLSVVNITFASIIFCAFYVVG